MGFLSKSMEFLWDFPAIAFRRRERRFAEHFSSPRHFAPVAQGRTT